MRLAVSGASGRMGRAVTRLAHAHGDQVVLALAHEHQGLDAGVLAGVGELGVALRADVAEALTEAQVDVVVDFSSPAGFAPLLAACVASGTALVSGTTGLTDTDREAMERAAAQIAVLWEPNTSVGVWVLSRLVRDARALLGPGFDVEIVEAHHKHKVDAPSGTALRLAEAASVAGQQLVHGREGKSGARAEAELGMHALRGGDVIGDHSVHFLGEGERLELVHRATNRDLFAQGALRAARWIASRQAGRYGLGDVLGL